MPDLARLYADTVYNHLGTVKAKKMIIVGASFGGVIATEMLQRLSSLPDSSNILKNVELVLLDAPVAGMPAASGFSKMNGLQSQGEIIAVNGNGNYSIELSPFPDDAPTEAVHHASIHALQTYSGPGATAPIGVPVLYVSARGEKLGKTDLGEKKLWWTHIFPALRWEELQSTHEELWQAKADEVLRFVKG